MTDVKVAVEPSSVCPGVGGPATGDVAVVFDQLVFPLPGWNDFIVVILEAWASALVRLLRGQTEHERVHFMEGPYAVDISELDGGAMRVRAIERPDRERVCADVRPLGLVQSVESAAEAVLHTCRALGLWSIDADRLDAARRALHDAAQKLAN